MKLIDLPARTDPCWNDPDWRFATLHQCVKAHGVSRDEIADLTGAKVLTVGIWLGGRGSMIGASTLRVLILELNARA